MGADRVWPGQEVFNGSPLYPHLADDSLKMESAIVSGPPFSVAAWVRPVDTATRMVLAIQRKNVSNSYFQLALTSSGTVRFRANDGDGNEDAETAATYTANQWNHVAAVAVAVDERRVYFNGGALNNQEEEHPEYYEGLNTLGVEPGNMDRTSIGARQDNAIGAYFSGLIALLAVWNVPLTVAEVAALARGVHPTLIRRGSLLAVWTFDGLDLYRSPIGNYLMTATGDPVQNPGPPVAYPSPARAGKDPLIMGAAAGTPFVQEPKRRSANPSRLKVYWYHLPDSDANEIKGAAPIARIELEKVNLATDVPAGYENYYPADCLDGFAHRVCDHLEAYNQVGAQWAFHPANLGEISDPTEINTTRDTPLHKHWEDAVPRQVGVVTRPKGRDSFYCAVGRDRAATISRDIGRAMLRVFQARGLSSMLSPSLMELIGDFESRNSVTSMLGTENGGTSGYFDFELNNENEAWSRYGSQQLLDGQTASELYSYLGEPAYQPAFGIDGEFDPPENREFARRWEPVLRMINEQSVHVGIVDPMRETLGPFKAMNYAMFSAANPAVPYRNPGTGGAYAEFNTYPKFFLDYGNIPLYPTHPDWGPIFGMGTIPPNNPAAMEALMLKMWWWNIRAIRGSGRPHICTIVYPGYYSRFFPTGYNFQVSGTAVAKGYEMLVRAGHSKIIQHLEPLPQELTGAPGSAVNWSAILYAVDRAMHLADQLHGGWRSRVFLSRNWR